MTFSQRGGAESTTEIILDSNIQLLTANDALPEGAVKLAQYAVINAEVETIILQFNLLLSFFFVFFRN